MNLLLLVGLGGALGAAARYGTALAVHRFVPATTFPWATLLINVSGSFLLGLLMRLMDAQEAGSAWRALILVGVLGGFTTFSTFSLEAVQLLQAREYLRAGSYVAASVALALAALAAGVLLGGLWQRS